jgi:hypothetical protein
MTHAYRDVKPANVLIEDEARGYARIGDVGIARHIGVGATHALTSVQGTPRYEQCRHITPCGRNDHLCLCSCTHHVRSIGTNNTSVCALQCWQVHGSSLCRIRAPSYCVRCVQCWHSAASASHCEKRSLRPSRQCKGKVLFCFAVSVRVFFVHDARETVHSEP